MAAAAWKNRITGTGEEDPEQLLANPRNWRIHPKHQQDALDAVLNEVGWVQNVIVNQRTGHVVDGHLRVSLALRREEKSVPVVYVDLLEQEESLILATIDPLSALAATDKAKLDELLHEVETGSPDLQKMLAELATQNGLYAEEAEQPDTGQANKTLSERFLVPPFSVLDARQGYWQDRKRAWLALGIESELGRGGGSKLTMSTMVQELKPSADQALKHARERERELVREVAHGQPAITATGRGAMDGAGRSEGLTWGDSAPMRHRTLNYYREQNKK